MEEVALLLWIRKNWKLLCVLGAGVTLFYTGDHHGATRVKTRWTLAIVKEREEAVKERDVLQAKADKAGADYEAEKAKAKKNLPNLNRRTDEILTKNVALRNCVIDPEFLRVYVGAVSATTPREPTSEPIR